jgi:hypothetical protein
MEASQKPLHCANCVKPALSFLFLQKKYYCPVCFLQVWKTIKRLSPGVVLNADGIISYKEFE